MAKLWILAWVSRKLLEDRTVYFGIELDPNRWWTDKKTTWIDGDQFDFDGFKDVWVSPHPWEVRDGAGIRFRWIMNYQGGWATVGPNDPRVNGFICEWDN